MTDEEVYEALFSHEISPTELDIWYAELPNEPTNLQARLYAQGRMWLLASELRIKRVLSLQGPAVLMSTIWVDLSSHQNVPPSYFYERSCIRRSALPPWGAWLVPADELAQLTLDLEVQGYACSTVPPKESNHA